MGRHQQFLPPSTTAARSMAGAWRGLLAAWLVGAWRGRHAAPGHDEHAVITPSQLTKSDGVLFGFPARFGMMAAQMKIFIDSTSVLWQTVVVSSASCLGQSSPKRCYMPASSMVDSSSIPPRSKAGKP